MKSAFTMIELVFVIVVLGILASVAIPRLAATRTDAMIAKGKSDIASIRAAIVSERQSRLITGDSDWITKLHDSNGSFFDNNGTVANSLLMYPIAAEDKDGHWHTVAGPTGADGVYTYQFKIEDKDNEFTYNPSNGTFNCTQGNNAPSCNDLTR